MTRRTFFRAFAAGIGTVLAFPALGRKASEKVVPDPTKKQCVLVGNSLHEIAVPYEITNDTWESSELSDQKPTAYFESVHGPRSDGTWLCIQNFPDGRRVESVYRDMFCEHPVGN